jgi:hypothetical protein
VAGHVKTGAAYLYNGRTGALISALTGLAPNDQIGIEVTTLTNGNYVVQNLEWGGGRGAVTFGNGRTGVSGTVSASNSLVGTVGLRLGGIEDLHGRIAPSGPRPIPGERPARGARIRG